MRKVLITVVVILTLFFVGLFIFILNKNSRSNNNSLKIHPTTAEVIEILSNVDPPFSHTDTLLLETGWKLCGNTPNGFEVPIPLQLEDIPFVEKLRTWANSTALTSEESDKILDTIVIYSVMNNRNTFTTSKRNKIYVLVNLEQSKKDGRFLVYENFLYIDTFRRRVKEFKIDRSVQTEK
jgi:hypothetical protein